MYSDKIIISKLYGLQEVANFNLTGQIFIFLFTFFNFFTIPFWSTYTDSFYRGDYSWIKDSIIIQIYICILFIFIGLLIYYFSEKIFNIWIGDEIIFNNILSLSWLIFIIFKCFNLIFTNFLNAVNELKIQIYLSIFVIIFNIPLSLFFANFLDLRAAGVLYGSISCLLIILFYQIYLYIKKIY